MRSDAVTRNGFAGGASHFEARSHHLRLPLARLIQLLMILQSERFPNVRRLAEACGVSRRTIYRDLTILETAGLSIVYQPERQGYQIGRDSILQPPQLDDREALAILIMSRLGNIPDPFGSLLPAQRALTKIIYALPPSLRNRIADTGELVPIADPAAEISDERRAVYETILGALVHRQRLRIRYREHDDNPASKTVFDLYRMVRVQGQWALVGNSSADGGVRLYWLPWLEEARTTGEQYAIPPEFRLERYLPQLQPRRSDHLREVHLRFSPKVAPLIRDMPEKSGQELRPAPDGTINLFLKVEAVDRIVHWVLGFGDQVEVIEPEDLRTAVCDWANRIIRRYEAGLA